MAYKSLDENIFWSAFQKGRHCCRRRLDIFKLVN